MKLRLMVASCVLALAGGAFLVRRARAPEVSSSAHPGSSIETPTLPPSISPGNPPFQGAMDSREGSADLDREISELREHLLRNDAPLTLIPILVRIEQSCLQATAAARVRLETVVSDETQDPKCRTMLAMLLTRHFAKDSGPLVLNALRRSRGAPAEGFVFALAMRPFAAPFAVQEAERFWFEGFHVALFGEAMFPEFHAKVAGTAGAPKSFRTWHDRIGPVDQGAVVTAALEAAVRTPDADERQAILFMLKPPSRDLKGLLEAVQGLMAGATDPDDKVSCLALLANDSSEATRRFLEEQALSAGSPEVRAKAALTLVRWDVPDVADRFQKIYSACPDASARQSLLDKAHRADTAAMQTFLLNVVSSERDVELRKSAVTSVGLTDGRLHVPEKQAILQRGMSDSDADVRAAALEAVGRLRWTALRENVRVLAASDTSEKVRSAASRTLAELGP